MIRILNLFFLLLSTASISTAQTMLGGVAAKGVDMNTVPGGIVTEIRRSESPIKGDTYLNSEWARMTLSLKDGVNVSSAMRYDIKLNQFEINIDGKLKAIQGAHVESFVLTNTLTTEKTVFINAKNYYSEGAKLIGFLREIESGEWSLFSRVEVELVEGSYNAVLDVGEEESKYVKKNRFLIGKGNELMFISSGSKRKFSDLFGSRAGDVFSYIKSSDLSTKEEEDLKSIVHFVNMKNEDEPKQ